jgi:hypothetical protein
MLQQGNDSEGVLEGAMSEARHASGGTGGRARPDRRGAVRTPCPDGIGCLWLSEPGREIPVGIRDISASGISVLLPSPFPAGTVLLLRFQNSQGSFSCERVARVVSEPICCPNDAWVHGCQFDTSLTPNDLARLITNANPG